jgi:Icc protein
MPTNREDTATHGAFDTHLPGSIKIIQFTDTHLCADPQGTLMGLNTLESLQRCIDHATENDLDADLVLATGDLVHDGSPRGYAHLARALAPLDVPVYALAGNHDDLEVMKHALSNPPVDCSGRTLRGRWQLILLDSNIPGSDGGRLSEAELERLDHCLEEYPEHHALICLHHQPVPIGSSWMDTMRVENQEPFFRILDRHAQVRGVLWGHVHQEFDAVRHGVRLLASPSTCVQFLPGSDDFAVEATPPGYRWLVLGPDGSIDTGVSRIDSVPDGLDTVSGGY